MGLIQRIKQLLNRNKPRLETSDIVGYQTSLVYIPKYSELPENKKALVDSYMAETDITKLEDMILYGNTVSQYANSNTELLINLFYRLTDEHSTRKINEMQEHEILQERLSQMIMVDELELYKTALKNLEEEATLRTVALEELQKRKRKDFSIWGIFERAERIQRKNQEGQLEAAIERMKINKKMIEQQTQSITNTMRSGRISNTVY